MMVSLRPDLQKYVEEKVASGAYPDAAAVLNDALQMMRAQEATTPAEIEELRQEFAAAVAQADRGEFIDFDAEQIISRGMADLRRERGE